MENLLIADIGGTNTRLQITDTKGNILHEYITNGFASIEDTDTPLPLLENKLQEIPEKESIRAIAINLGGKNTVQITNCFRGYFPDVPLKIFRESEGMAAYALGEEYNSPVILMAGTGAIAAGKSENGFVITGGWGIHIGDDGSGYDIGLQAIRAALRALDDTKPLTPLMKLICGCDEPILTTTAPELYRDKRDLVRQRIYPLERQKIASLTKTVAEYAEKGDSTALDLFKYSGEKLSELVLCTAKKLSGEIDGIVVTGGLIHAKKFWKPYFEEAVKNSLPQTKIHYISEGILKGTLKIAQDLYNGGETK